MPDYLHDLRFGTFITPVASPPHRAVELAIEAEGLGLDLVTFQDHPYQSSFHDTWTLMSWIAAQTSRIHLSGNVMNVALRPPSVLARAAASLDLLSEGRVALGLGAGYFWDAVATMGGRKLTQGDAITGLEEALDIIHSLWDTSARTPASAGGQVYSLKGAQRGPAPAHDIPIWLGAYKPRMQRLIGRKADGWLPGLPAMQPGDYARGNVIIDEAARKAGREPSAIARLLNITQNESVDDLVRFALEDGVSVFILLAGDDPAAARRFAEQTAPAVRERVAEARATTVTSPSPKRRSAASLAKRKKLIDYDSVPASLVELAVEPGDAGYARHTASYLRGGSPGLVLRPQTAEQVQDAVRFADLHREVPLGIYSAGHGVSGRSLNHGGLVIDVSAINHIEPLDNGRVRIGPGARWIEVARVLSPLGLAISSGDYGGVGVGGLATAGGIGWFAREHGLTIDQLRSVDVVTADGELLHASNDENADLFWAMRGAGANFGVAVSFEFEPISVGRLAYGELGFVVDDVANFLEKWGTALESSDRSVTATVLLGASRPGQSSRAQASVVVDSDDPDTVIERLQPLLGVAPLASQNVSMAGYDDVMSAYYSDAPHQGQGEPLVHSAFVRHLDADTAAELGAMLRSGASHFFTIRSLGGAVADVPADATAYGWRDANFSVVAFGSADSGLDKWWTRLQSHFEGLYLSFESDLGHDVVARAFPPAHLRRLRQLKRRYDATGLFRDNFFIEPANDED